MENRNDADVQRLCDLLEKVIGASKIVTVWRETSAR